MGIPASGGHSFGCCPEAGPKDFHTSGCLRSSSGKKIPIAAIVGTSMGSIIGGLYASGYTSQEMKKYFKQCEPDGNNIRPLGFYDGRCRI